MRKQQIWVIIGVFAVLGGLYYYLFKYNEYPKYDWSMRYRPQGKEPYDLALFYKLLKKMDGVDVVVNQGKTVRKLELTQRHAYMFIGPGTPNYTEEDAKVLYQFLKNGGRALFICKGLSKVLSNELLRKEAAEHIYLAAEFSHLPPPPSKKIPLYLNGQKPRVQPEYFWKGPDTLDSPIHDHFILNPEWSYLKEPMHQLGFIGSETNFIEIPVGKGRLYWNCSPLAFTNYHLLRPEMLDYANAVVSNLDLKTSSVAGPKKEESFLSKLLDLKTARAGEKILVIDEVSKLGLPEDGDSGQSSPLHYILEQPSFRWAWYTLLFGVLAYLVLLARRRQRMIPLLPVKINASLHFIRAIADLYLRQESHYFMCQQKMKLFLNHIKTRYGIHSQGISEETVQALARRSGADPELVKSIFQDWNYIQEYSMANTTAQQLANFHAFTEQFYHQSK
jgi:hypothetical protein